VTQRDQLTAKADRYAAIRVTDRTTPAGAAIGTAGWSIPSALVRSFPGTGTHLQRYARVMSVVEINSSFYKPHRRATYERWAASTPNSFRFAAKLPKTITHTNRLINVDPALAMFTDQIGGLGTKLGIVLVQLPPSLAFDPTVAVPFFTSLRALLPVACQIACEPRHPSWFTGKADTIIGDAHVARVAADPVLAPGAEQPGGWTGLHYRRLHGAPHIYYSPYAAQHLSKLAMAIAADRSAGIESWCVFDNTASGAALADATKLQALVSGKS
jgi:uncharacterized protein YecE (DUF72 family)